MKCVAQEGSINGAVLPFKELGGITGVDLDLGEGDGSSKKGM